MNKKKKEIKKTLHHIGMILMLTGGFTFTTWTIVSYLNFCDPCLFRTLFGFVCFGIGAIIYGGFGE